jgi:methyl acetate hydrolase
MNRAHVDAVLADAAATGKVPGVVAAVATADGVVYQGAHGVREVGRPEPMTDDTLLWIASMTKAITTAAAMQLVERGALSLDAPAGELLPYLASVQVCDGFDSAGKPRLRPPRTPVTLRHLLTHTSGFVYNMWNSDMARYQAAVPAPAREPGRNVAFEMPLVFDPGARWEYGIGIDWAGMLVEAASGQRLGRYLDEYIFGPLGMTSTSFSVSNAQRARRASLHSRTANGLAPMASFMPDDPEFDGGGGGLHSTVPDYMQFLQMLLHGGTWNGATILAPETVASMSRNHIGALECTPMRSIKPSMSNDCDFFPGMPQKWGLSFLINTQASAEGRSAGSLAWAGLANSFYWIDPVKRVTAVMATQILPFCDDDALGLFRRFERAVYGGLGA